MRQLWFLKYKFKSNLLYLWTMWSQRSSEALKSCESMTQWYSSRYRPETSFKANSMVNHFIRLPLAQTWKMIHWKVNSGGIDIKSYSVTWTLCLKLSTLSDLLGLMPPWCVSIADTGWSWRSFGQIREGRDSPNKGKKYIGFQGEADI